MNVFELRNRLVTEYADYVKSFVEIRDERIRRLVEAELDAGLLWPEPIVQLNPAFEPGAEIDALCDEGVLHEGCRRIFRRKAAEDPVGQPLRLHRHQEEAIRIAATGESYVLTSGTGSGKSLTYLIPAVDRVLRDGPGKGIRAIVVYPMNALANSQLNELHKFLDLGFPGGRGPVRFRRYTGQESDAERREIIAEPPKTPLNAMEMVVALAVQRANDTLWQQRQLHRHVPIHEPPSSRRFEGCSPYSYPEPYFGQFFAPNTRDCYRECGSDRGTHAKNIHLRKLLCVLA